MGFCCPLQAVDDNAFNYSCFRSIIHILHSQWLLFILWCRGNQEWLLKKLVAHRSTNHYIMTQACSPETHYCLLPFRVIKGLLNRQSLGQVTQSLLPHWSSMSCKWVFINMQKTPQHIAGKTAAIHTLTTQSRVSFSMLYSPVFSTISPSWGWVNNSKHLLT